MGYFWLQLTLGIFYSTFCKGVEITTITTLIQSKPEANVSELKNNTNLPRFKLQIKKPTYTTIKFKIGRRFFLRNSGPPKSLQNSK